MTSYKAQKDLEKKIKDLAIEAGQLKAAMSHFELTRTSHQILLSALQGGLVDFYKGSTDEIALRCIAMAQSLDKQLDLVKKAEVPADAANVAEGDLVGGGATP